MSGVRLLFALCIAASGCSDGNAYLLVRMTSATPLLVEQFSFELVNAGASATATITPPASVALPPEQQVRIQIEGAAMGTVEVTAHAEAAHAELAVASGQVEIVPSGTVELELAFGAAARDAGDDADAAIGMDAGVDLTTPPDLAGVPAVSFAVTTTVTAVKEHEALNLHIVGKNAGGQVETGFDGTVALTSSWGDVTPTAPLVFTAGVCDIAVSLNRETRAGFAGAYITASDGGATGTSPEIIVTVGDWKVDGSKVRVAFTYMQSLMVLQESAPPGAVIAAPGGGYRLIGDRTLHMGGSMVQRVALVGTSPDGMDWTFNGGILGGTSAMAGLAGASISWDGTSYRALYSGTDNSSMTLLYGATSPNAIA